VWFRSYIFLRVTIVDDVLDINSVLAMFKAKLVFSSEYQSCRVFNKLSNCV
jgi:hypothetical protein